MNKRSYDNIDEQSDQNMGVAMKYLVNAAIISIVMRYL